MIGRFCMKFHHSDSTDFRSHSPLCPSSIHASRMNVILRKARGKPAEPRHDSPGPPLSSKYKYKFPCGCKGGNRRRRRLKQSCILFRPVKPCSNRPGFTAIGGRHSSVRRLTKPGVWPHGVKPRKAGLIRAKPVLRRDAGPRPTTLV